MRAELLPGTVSVVALGICANCKGKIASHSTSPDGSGQWIHMATVGPDGKGQHGEVTCPPPGSRP